MRITNPATEETREIEETPISQIPKIVADAHLAQAEWREVSLATRSNILSTFSELINQNEKEIASTISADMGKPMRAALKEAAFNSQVVKFLCEKSLEWLAPEKCNDGTIYHEPLGVVAVISPWNYPFSVPNFGIIPALLAGNSVVLKPSEYTLETGKLIGQIVNEINELPKNCFQVVVGGKEHGEKLANENVQMIAFTGSTATGKKIMASCAEGIKRVHLELGGLDAAIVLEDADVDLAAKRLVQTNCVNTGQVCCAVKRVYVPESSYEQFLESAIKYSKEVTYGDPSTEVKMGPLVAKFQQEKVASIVEDAKSKGATIHTGGEVPEMKGFFYPSTIVSDVTEDMRILNEEPFGPILPIVKYSNVDEAIEKANATEYGLTASVWSSSQDKASEIARKLDVGQVGINGHACAPIGSPFGGAKQSGIGRTQSKEGMQSFTNTKFVYSA